MPGESFWLPQGGAGSSLDDLSDVDTATTPPSDGQSLVYDDASSLWVPGTAGAGTSASVASGSATIPSGSTSVSVAHGLSSIPTISQFVITPTNSLGAATKWWLQSVSSTTLTIAVNAAPGGSETATFTWRAFSGDGSGSYFSEIQGDSPALLLPLDDASGTTAEAITGTDGTYVGSPTLAVSGPARVGAAAVRLNGTSQYVTAAPPAGFSGSAAQTHEMWVYHPTQIDSTSGISTLLGTNQTGTAILFGAVTSAFAGEVVTVANDAGGSSDRTGWTGFTITAGWHHHVLTYNGTQNGWTYYLDGAATGTKVGFSGGAFGFSSAWSWHLGYTSSYSSAARYFAGDLSAYAAYGSELTAGQVLTHYSG